MPPVFDSLIPILGVTFLGWALNARAVITQDQWNGFERVIYVVFFPALIVHTLAMADLHSVPALATAGSMLIALAVVAGGLVIARPLLERMLGIDGPAFTSHFQGSIRWNTFVAIGLAGSLYGARGLTLVAVALAAILPFVNVVSVWAMRRYVAGNPGGFDVLGLLRNPFVWSSLLGLALNLTGTPVPKFAASMMEILGRAALGAALLLVGSGLRLKDMRSPTPALAMTLMLKLIVLPLIAVALARALGVSGADIGVIVICAAVPTAGASYILSRQMGGDSRLMANIITTQTIVSAATLPAMLWLLG